MMFTYTTAVVFAAALTIANSIEAPPSACLGLVPLQPALPQASPPPYSIIPAAATIKPGTSMQVTIKSMPSVKMSGILLQARQGDKIVGKWTISPNDDVARLLDCGEPGDTVTHKEHIPELDKDTVTYLWTAPADLEGEVKFKASITKSFMIYWVGLTSTPVKILKTPPA